MAYIYNLTDSWTAVGTSYSGIKMAVTNTASAASSKLLDLSVSGATTGSFTVDKSGNAAVSGTMSSGATTITAASATALTVGANGATNPVWTVNSSTASVATGVSVTGAAAAAGVALAVTSSGTNEALKIDGKGSGNISLNSVGTGNVGIGAAPLASTKFYVYKADGNFAFGVAGTTKGIRFATTSVNASMDATDNTLAASYQPFKITASELQLGAITKPDSDNAYTLGASGARWSAVWAVNGTIQTSDVNAKTEIIDSPLGLDFIESLRPVAYKFKVGGNIIDRDAADSSKVTITAVPGKRQHFGLIAQEVKTALPAGVDFGGWVLTDAADPDSEQGLRYEEFIAPLIKAVQELKAELDAIKASLP
jgi:hypothetical protein